MNKFKIEKGISRIPRVKLQATIEEVYPHYRCTPFVPITRVPVHAGKLSLGPPGPAALTEERYTVG
jgi:hypothetical protein